MRASLGPLPLTVIRLVLPSTVRLSRGNAAYDLAERYRDFRSLVVLCNDASLGSPARIHFYIQKYKEDFAYALYDWYLETGALVKRHACTNFR